MEITDIQVKVENGGATQRGKLSAEEFNAMLEQVITNMRDNTALSQTVTNNYKELKGDISAVQRTIDGGNSTTKYGGVRKFNCGGA